MADRTVPLLAGAVVAVVVLAILVSLAVTTPFDQAVIDVIRAPELHDALAFLRPVTELGSTWAVTIVAGLALAVGLTIGPWRHGIIAAVTIGVASLGVEGVKALIARERPDLLEPQIAELGFSFPSGHASLSMVAYGILAVLVTRSFVGPVVRAGSVVVVAMLVFLIGLSRVWLGVHYPTDVLAGWLAGGIVVTLFAMLTREVPSEPAAAAAAEDRAAPRSDPPATG